MRKFAALALGAPLAILVAVLVANTLRGGAVRRPASSRSRRCPSTAWRSRSGSRARSSIETVSLGEGRARSAASAFRALHDLLARDFPRLHAALEREIVAEGSLLFRWPGSIRGAADPADGPPRRRAGRARHRAALDAPALLGCDRRRVRLGPRRARRQGVACSGSPRRSSFCRRGLRADAAASTSRSVTTRRSAATSARRSIAAAPRGARREARLHPRRGHGHHAARACARGRPRVALIGLAEKGYLSLELAATAAGGHSSTPPRDAAVYRLSRALARVEQRPQPEAMRGPVAAHVRHARARGSLPHPAGAPQPLALRPGDPRALRREPAQAALLHTTTAPTCSGPA